MKRADKVRVTVIAVLLASATSHVAAACAASSRTSITGPVLDVPEAGVICVALGPRPEQWVRVRLAGPETIDRKRLMAAAFSRRVDCALTTRGWSCRIGSDDLATLAGSRDVGLTAASWR